MGQAVIATAATKTHLCTRSSLFTCFAAIFYDPEARVGTVSHLHAMSELQTHLTGILTNMERLGARRGALQAHFVGGARIETLQRNMFTLYRFCQEHGVHFVGTNISSSARPVSTTLSLADGRITTSSMNPRSGDITENRDSNQEFLIFPP